ncbi:hypothetical protein M409DRAFT_24162 [Zasmidium cellare ATCC 36951]|uniref:Uncharacterized protein n=1 Tax=Zasmidium cellare ATCC 36951 TaxID=1080233 RepID=A0A6A6CH93_ZASCE|nr:uncharacterized protein M409DRAFT_24162 [Zasmidium cellare ATCC 36951]KAF2165312.1 hypothetical protein M409DRAFT_24162 [Zasmidium cellare ATCC 36951]
MQLSITSKQAISCPTDLTMQRGIHKTGTFCLVLMQAYAEPRSTLSYTTRKRLDSAFHSPRTKEVDKDAISSTVPVPALAIKPLDEWDMEGRTIWSLNGRAQIRDKHVK